MSITLTGLDALSSLMTTMQKAQQINKADSYISYTKPARVEPITLIDDDCMYSELMPDLLQTLLSTFSAYYLQAFALSVNVGNINVVKHLEKLNPNRDPLSEISFESYDCTYKLPSFSVSMEATPVPQMNIRDGSKEIKEVSNFSVGKLLNVELTQGEQKATLPIAIRLMTNVVRSENLAHILTAGSRKDTSLKERWHGWRSGKLEFIKDLILCQDLIDAHKKNLVQDKTGLYSHLLKRRQNNALSAMMNAEVSVGSASNICIISSDTARKIEVGLMGSLDKFSVREKLFSETYIMILAVLDKEWNTVKFYYRGIPEHSTAGARDLKAHGKDSGTDVMSILNAFREGKSVAL